MSRLDGFRNLNSCAGVTAAKSRAADGAEDIIKTNGDVNEPVDS